MKPPICIAYTLALLVVYVNCGAIPVPTQDETIIVAKTDSDVSEAATADATTEEPSAPLKLTDMIVQSEVSLRYAHTAVVTHVKNPSRRSQQTTFHVLLPETAFITSFVMTLSGKSYKAYVKEKEEAKKIYTEAVSQGIGAAHVAAKARDSNHFTVTVNVEPNSKATFNLTYEELLVRRNGIYNHAINLHPGAIVPHMEVRVHIKESQKINLLRVPEVRTGNEIDATANDAQNKIAVIQKSGDEKEATVIFTPDVEEQKRLMRLYADKSKESQTHHWDREENSDKEGTIGQFVVQYDVERPDKGEILVNDGYFVHFFAPKSLTPLNKYVVFVLDTSGSMGGRSIDQLRAAMRAILADLNHNDYFSIVEFDSDVQVHKLKEADEPEPAHPHYHWRSESKPVELVPPSIASPQNIAKAQVIISRLGASGGTNIYEALKVALDLIQKTYEKNESISNSTEVQPSGLSELEPIIIFLTDGDPTVGEISTKKIISHMTEKNSGPKKAAIFSLAFGEDADRTFLRKLSLRNDGFMRHIYEAADAELQLRHFYQQVSSPLLAGVRFVYPPNQVKEGSVTRHKYKAIYDGSEIVVAGKIDPSLDTLEPTVLAFYADPNDHNRKKPYEVRPKLTLGPAGEYLPLERLWAYLSVKQLLDEREVSEHPEDIEKRVLDIALKYAFVTPLTSLVVVKPNATDAVNAESVDDSNKPSYGSYLSMALPGPSAYPGIVPLSGVSSPLDFDIRLEEESVDDYAMRFRSSPQRHHLGAAHGSMSRWGPSSIFGGYTNNMLPLANRADVHRFADHDLSLIVGGVTTFASTTAQPLEDKYHLGGFSWALSLLNDDTGALEFSSNGKNVTLEVSKDSDPPRSSAGDEECSNSVNLKKEGADASENATGVCVYLTRCAAAADLAADAYRATYCTVNNKYAGVCCPRSQVDVKKA